MIIIINNIILVQILNTRTIILESNDGNQKYWNMIANFDEKSSRTKSLYFNAPFTNKAFYSQQKKEQDLLNVLLFAKKWKFVD